jgi:dienelactone hydrolase
MLTISSQRCRRALLLGSIMAAIVAATWPGRVRSQERTQPPPDVPIEREKLSLSGWDPDEPVPAYAYYKKGNRAMPVVIFMHGIRGSKEGDADRLRKLADKGYFVLAIDAYLHGERKVPGMFDSGKVGEMGNDYGIWVHQASVSHTARDVSKIIDALSARGDVDASRVAVMGISMGSSTCMVVAWREPRVSVVVAYIGAVDFWYDVTKTAPGPDQEAKVKALSPRVRQLVGSINPQDHKTAIASKALFLANGAKDKGIDIQSIKSFVKDLQPSYKDRPEKLKFLEEPDVGHSVTDRMWTEGTDFLLRHLPPEKAKE